MSIYSNEVTACPYGVLKIFDPVVGPGANNVNDVLGTRDNRLILSYSDGII